MAQKTRAEIHDDYEAFVAKFSKKASHKLTTDDCYIPAEIYDTVVEWVNKNILDTRVGGVKILRPFYPGGDYQAEEYDEDTVVIDNPPFSITASIVRWYLDNNIRFFLFSDGLKQMNSSWRNDPRVCFICTTVGIKYTNGAVVATSFVTNMAIGKKLWVAGDLAEALDVANRRNQSLPKLSRKGKMCYTDNVIHGTLTNKVSSRGVSMVIRCDECEAIRELDAQKKVGTGIYGGGFLLSEGAAKRWRAAQDEAARRKLKDEAEVFGGSELVRALSDGRFQWQLSEREREIVAKLK